MQVSLNGQQYDDTGVSFRFHEYCSGRVTLTEPEGAFYDHPVEKFTSGPPRPYSLCEWHINVPPQDDAAASDEMSIALQVAPPDAVSTRSTEQRLRARWQHRPTAQLRTIHGLHIHDDAALHPPP